MEDDYIYNDNSQGKERETFYYTPVYRDSESSGGGNKNSSKKRGTALLVVACLLISLVSGFAGGALANRLGIGAPAESRSGGNSLVKASVVRNGKDESKALSVSEIAERCAPTVVEITTESVVRGSFMGQYVTTGAGSGVIVSENGYILTCYHVVEGASTVKVKLTNGKMYDAVTVGFDDENDLAICKIEESGLACASFGDSDELIVGETVVAIGNPLGELGGTVTDGIVSALSREVEIEGQTMSLLQTNAAINPGNSGGGLFDTNGNLIGIVNAKSAGEDIEGLGFAIPSAKAADIADELMDHGYVSGRVKLGAVLVDITTDRELYYYGVSARGVYVYSVTLGGCAASSGLQSGDRIISVNGTEVGDSSVIESLLRNTKVGDKWQMVISRGRNEMTVEINFTEYIPN